MSGLNFAHSFRLDLWVGGFMGGIKIEGRGRKKTIARFKISFGYLYV